MKHELSTVEEFLGQSDSLRECIASNNAIFEEIKADWMRLKQSLLSPHVAEGRDSFPHDKDFSPITLQTQGELLFDWRTEFETPQIPRVATNLHIPTSPTLFEDEDMLDFDLDDEGLRFPTQGSSQLMLTEPVFTTAGGKTIPPPSPATQKRTLALFEEENVVPVNTVPVSFVGFSTASGKKMKDPSKVAMAKANNILRETALELDHMASAASIASQQDAQVDEIPTPLPVNVSPCLFKTASGKGIKSPSKDSRAKAAAVLGETPETPKFSMFASASGKSIAPPSAEALKKASAIVGEFERPPVEHDTRPKGFRPFKAPSILDPSKSPLCRAKSSPTLTSPTSERKLQSPLNLRDPRRVERSPCSPRIRANTSVKKDLLERRSLKSFESLVRRPSLPVSSPIHQDFHALALTWLPEADERWIQNHLRLILWKVQAYRRTGVMESVMAGLCLEDYVRDQFYDRRHREYDLAERSILKKIVERDDSPSGYAVYFISDIKRSNNDDIEVYISDGWYNLQASHDFSIQRLIVAGRIKIGQKIKVALAQIQSEEACEILEAESRAVQIKLSGNSVRPARWHCTLGKQKRSIFTISLRSIEVDGGLTACVHVAVIRRYPAIYMVEWESGKRKSFNEDEFNRLQVAEGDVGEDRISLVKISSKVRVVDMSDCPVKALVIITFWESNPEFHAKLTEGAQMKIVGLKPTMKRKDIMCLSSNRSSKTIFLPNKADISLYRPSSLVPGEFLSLDLQRDYDIFGLVLNVQDSQHSWVLMGEDEAGLVAVRMLHPSKAIASNRPIYILDVSFLYLDPRHGFPVFLFGEHSQLVCDESRFPARMKYPTMAKSSERIAKSIEFVRSIL